MDGCCARVPVYLQLIRERKMDSSVSVSCKVSLPLPPLPFTDEQCDARNLIDPPTATPWISPRGAAAFGGVF